MNKEELIRKRESVWLCIEGLFSLGIIISGYIIEWDKRFLLFFSVIAFLDFILSFGLLKKKEILLLSGIIHLLILNLLVFCSKGKIIMMVMYYLGMMPTVIPVGLLFLRNTIFEFLNFLFFNIVKDKEIRQDKKRITWLHIIVLVLSAIWIAFFTVYLDKNKHIVLDDSLYFCQPLYDEYYELELSTLQIKDFELTKIPGYEDNVIMVNFKRLNDGDTEYDKEKIIQCTDDFINSNPKNELLEYVLFIDFEKIERGGYDTVIKYTNGKLVED